MKVEESFKRGVGTIKFYKPAAGYGFIVPDDEFVTHDTEGNIEELFFHVSNIEKTTEVETITKDARCKYNKVEGKKGFMAIKVKIIEEQEG